MKLFSLFCSIAIFLLPSTIYSQSTVKIYGKIVDAETKQPLFGANVMIAGTGFGASSDQQGEYQIENLFEGEYSISVSYIGYKDKQVSNIKIDKDQPVRINFQLKQRIIPLKGVQISAEKEGSHSRGNFWTIENEAIARSNAQNVGELIDMAPGVDVQDTGGRSGSKKLSIRGSQSNQVLVLLDGVPLNDELSGDVDLSKIPANVIEKIEIYKGGFSHRFGSGAIGGVVNIITKKNFASQIQMNSGYGSFHTVTLEPSCSGNFKRFNYYFAVQYAKTDGDFPYEYNDSKGESIHENRMNADLYSQNIFGRMNYQSPGHIFSIHAQHMKSERGIPGVIDAWTAYARSKNNQRIAGTEYRFTNDDFNAELSYRYSVSETENSNLYPNDADIRYRRYPKYHYKYGIQNHIVHANFNYDLFDWYTVSSGYDYRDLNYEDENFRSYGKPPINEASDVAHGVFLHQELHLQLLSGRSHLLITPDLRYDEMNIRSGDFRRHEHQWSPGTSFRISAGTIHQAFVTATLSNSFRVPTFADLFYQDVRIEGKPDLLPEKSQNREIGCGFKISSWGELNAEVTAFRNTIDDLIVWRLGSYEVFRPFNSDAEIFGEEYLLKFNSPGDYIGFEIGYVHLKPLNKNKNETTYDKIIPYRPLSSLKGQLSLGARNLFLNLKYRDIGKRYITEANTKYLDGYQVFDADFFWKMNIRDVELTWKLSAYNITDEKYEIIRNMPLPGREWRFGLNLIY